MRQSALLILVLLATACISAEDETAGANQACPEYDTACILEKLRSVNSYPREVEAYLDLLERHAVTESEDSTSRIDKRIIGEWVLLNPFVKNEVVREEFFTANVSKNGYQSRSLDQGNLPEFLTIKADGIDWLVRVNVMTNPPVIGRSIEMYYIDEDSDLMYTRFINSEFQIWEKQRSDDFICSHCSQLN